LIFNPSVSIFEFFQKQNFQSSYEFVNLNFLKSSGLEIKKKEDKKKNLQLEKRGEIASMIRKNGEP